MTKQASGKYALGLCDQCGLTYKLTALRPVIVARKESGWLMCDDCWEPDNPRLIPPRVEADAEALRNPRPDNKTAPGLINLAWGWNPVYAQAGVGSVGAVTVTIGS